MTNAGCHKLDALEVEELCRLVQEGIESGPGLAGDEVFAELRVRHGATEA